MPASVVTVIASFTSGFEMFLSADWTATNPGRAAMIAPNPYSDAVFIAARRDPDTAV